MPGIFAMHMGLTSVLHPHRIHGAGIYANIGGILMGSMLPYISIYSIHGSYGIHNYFRTLRMSTMIQTFSHLKLSYWNQSLSSHTGRQVGCWIIFGQSSKSYPMPSHCRAHICFSDVAMYLFSLLGLSETHIAIQPIMYPIGSMYAIYGNMDPINIPPMLAYIPYMDPMG